MKFFLDTANVDEIREAADIAILDGVTTNPTLVAKEGRDFHPLIAEIAAIVAPGPVNAEVTAVETEAMVSEGEKLARIAENVVVKIPMTRDGMKAVKRLAGAGIRVNVTLVFSPTQALIAAKAGASYVSPFVGRLDDISIPGMDLVRDMIGIFRNYRYAAEVLVGSIRHPVHVIEAARAGAHIATMPAKVLEILFKHPLTDIGLDRFLADWRKALARD